MGLGGWDHLSTDCRFLIPSVPRRAAPRTHPPWAWGRLLDPRLDTSAFMQPCPGALKSIAPL